MKLGKALTTGLGLGILVILVALVTPKILQYQRQNSHARLEAATALSADVEARNKISDRVTALAVDGCQSRAVELIKLYDKNPAITKSDVPAAIADDLKLCLERGIMRKFVMGDLEDRGLLSLITTNQSKS